MVKIKMAQNRPDLTTHIPNNFTKPPELRDITASLKQCIYLSRTELFDVARPIEREVSQ